MQAGFASTRHRRRYVARRGILRELIGSYLDCDPAGVAFVHNAYGKPAIAQSDLRFNLSHSHGMALYAFCRYAEVGCDIERRDPKFAAEQIPERFFSPDEVRALRSLPLNEQTEAFFNCWTRKEAYIKAVGHGLVDCARQFRRLARTGGAGRLAARMRRLVGAEFRALDRLSGCGRRAGHELALELQGAPSVYRNYL